MATHPAELQNRSRRSYGSIAMVSDPRGRSTSVGVEGRRSRNRGRTSSLHPYYDYDYCRSRRKNGILRRDRRQPRQTRRRRRTSPQSGDSSDGDISSEISDDGERSRLFPDSSRGNRRARRISRRFPAAYYMPTTDMEVCGDSDVDLLKSDVIPKYDEVGGGGGGRDSPFVIDVREQPRWRTHTYIYLNRPGTTHHFLLFLILINVLSFIFSTEQRYYDSYPWFFETIESITVLLFTAEFFLRISTVGIGAKFRPLTALSPLKLRQGMAAKPGDVPGSVMNSRDEIKTALAFCLSFAGVVDLLSILPWWLERSNLFGPMPTTTPIRVLRVLRLLNHTEFLGAVKVLARVLYFNKEVLTVAGLIGVLLLLGTSTLLYIVNQPDAGGNSIDDVEAAATAAQFSSVPATMYLSILMLTGQGEPDGELSPITKFLCVVTAVGSVAVFAIPASMLAWGFEAEAERFIHLREEAHHRRRQKSKQSADRLQERKKIEKTTGSSINDDVEAVVPSASPPCLPSEATTNYYDRGFLTASSESSEWLLSDDGRSFYRKSSSSSDSASDQTAQVDASETSDNEIGISLAHTKQGSTKKHLKNLSKPVSESESIFAKKKEAGDSANLIALRKRIEYTEAELERARVLLAKNGIHFTGKNERGT